MTHKIRPKMNSLIPDLDFCFKLIWRSMTRSVKTNKPYATCEQIEKTF